MVGRVKQDPKHSARDTNDWVDELGLSQNPKPRRLMLVKTSPARAACIYESDYIKYSMFLVLRKGNRYGRKRGSSGMGTS